jgi:GNAT superfamily N-acetyltransferase
VPLSIRQLTNPDEIGIAGCVLGNAFAREKVFIERIPDPVERLRFCHALYTAGTRRCLRVGSVWIAETDDATIAGVLCLADIPEPTPGDSTDTDDGYDAIDAEWPEMFAWFDPIEEAGRPALLAQPAPWRYLSVIGVDPDHQRSGVGTALMRHATAGADTAGLALGLMTERAQSARFYERFGFQTLIEGHESDPLILWVMHRPPVPA